MLLRSLEGHSSGVTAAQFSPDGSRVVTASDDYSARIWDVHLESRHATDLVRVANRCSSIRLEAQVFVPHPIHDCVPDQSDANGPATQHLRAVNLEASGTDALRLHLLALANERYLRSAEAYRQLGDVEAAERVAIYSDLTDVLGRNAPLEPSRLASLRTRLNALQQSKASSHANESALLSKLAGIAQDTLLLPRIARELLDRAHRANPTDVAILAERAEPTFAVHDYDDYLGMVSAARKGQPADSRLVLDVLTWAAHRLRGDATSAKPQALIDDYAVLLDDHLVRWQFAGTRHALLYGPHSAEETQPIVEVLNLLEQPVSAESRAKFAALVTTRAPTDRVGRESAVARAGGDHAVHGAVH
jgi:hypothetical protein